MILRWLCRGPGSHGGVGDARPGVTASSRLSCSDEKAADAPARGKGQHRD